MLLPSKPKFKRGITVRAHKRYRAYYGRNAIEKLLNAVAMIVDPENNNGKILLLADEKVFELYGARVMEVLSIADEKVYPYLIRSGESCKTQKTVDDIIDKLRKENFTRSDVLVNLGGGSVCDVGGYAACIYKRGMPYINVPTTVMAMADGAIGGKTGIDFYGSDAPEKNMLGAFYQPRVVICDTSFLDSLSDEHIKEGLAEIIKCAVIKSKRLFNGLEQKSVPLEKAIYKAAKIKASLIRGDEYEFGKRKLLAYGHTVGYAIESASNFEVTHGQAVAMGMVAECGIFEEVGLSHEISLRIESLLKSFEIDINWRKHFALDKKEEKGVFKVILADKKREGEEIMSSVPLRIGKARLIPVTISKVNTK